MLVLLDNIDLQFENGIVDDLFVLVECGEVDM